MHTKKMKEVNDNSPLKTDDKDPRVIADIIRLGRALTIVVPEGDAAYLRRLNNARNGTWGSRQRFSISSSNSSSSSSLNQNRVEEYEGQDGSAHPEEIYHS